jgi:O-antigen/teichoic acid export membrane protein
LYELVIFSAIAIVNLCMIKKYLSASLKTVFVSLLSLIFSFLLLKVQLSFIGVGDRGVMILAQTNVAVLISLLRFGVGQSVIRAIPDYNRSVVSANFIFLSFIQAVLIGIIIFLLFCFTNFFGNNLDKSSVFAIATFGVSTLLFNAISNFSFLQLNSMVFMIQVLLFGILNIGLLYFAGIFFLMGIKTVLFCISTAQLCVLIFLLNFLPKFRFVYIQKELIKRLIFEGASSIGWSFIKDLSYKIDLLIFGNILGKNDFGIYSVLQNLCQSVWRITDSVMASYSKFLLNLNKDDYVKFTNFLIFLLIVVSFLGIIGAYFIITPVFGFIADMDMTQYLFSALILLFAVLIFNIWKLIANFFIQIGRNTPMYLTLCLLITFFYIFKNYVSTLKEAALTTAAVYLLITLLIILFYKMVIREKQFRSGDLN